jgi:AraC-like DNA-binding protein
MIGQARAWVLKKSDMESASQLPSYVEVAPPAPLAPLVASLWEMCVPDVGQARVRILPNACVDIVIYASETSRGEGPAMVVAPPYRRFVVGSTLRSFVARSTGWRRVIGASLLPAGVQPLLRVPARVIAEGIVTLDDVIGHRAAQIEERVLSGPGDRALQRLAEVLLAWSAFSEPNQVIARAVGAVRAAGGMSRMDTVASDANISARKLERNFLEHVGISAKTYSRLVRFDRAARGIAGRVGVSWSRFALDHGYSDQAHFINEFKEFAGITPLEYEKELVDLTLPPAVRAGVPPRVTD